MKRNEELFRKVADAIERNPDSYNQNAWCGTQACVAGWAVAIERCNGNIAFERVMDAVNDIHDAAAELLRLDYVDAADLFRASWEPHDGLSVPDALRKIGEGAHIADVSRVWA